MSIATAEAGFASNLSILLYRSYRHALDIIKKLMIMASYILSILKEHVIEDPFVF